MRIEPISPIYKTIDKKDSKPQTHEEILKNAVKILINNSVNQYKELIKIYRSVYIDNKYFYCSGKI